MRWEDERYVRIYTRNTTDWIALPWQGRAVFYELSRHVDRTGFIALGKSGERGLAGLLLMPLDVVDPGVTALVEDGCVVRVDGGLLIRNFIEAQETPQSDKLRKRSQRERDRDTKKATATDAGPASHDVTPGHADAAAGEDRDDSSQNVTESHEPSRAVTPGHARSLCAVPYRAVPNQKEEDILSPAAAGAAIDVGAPVDPSHSGPVMVFSPSSPHQMALLGGADAPTDGKPKRRAKEPPPPSPVTELRDVWRGQWEAAGMPGPAPWDAASASAAQRYLGTPGATQETARQAFVGMLRTPAGEWHRTNEGGRHATVHAALAGKHVVAFTGAGKALEVARAAAAAPKREIPPPRPIPQMYRDMAAADERNGARIPTPPLKAEAS